MVGVLALQGDYRAHAARLASLGYETKEVRTASHLNPVTALVIPGGESSVFLKLLEPDLEKALVEIIQGGVPTLATCAGIILLANEVKNPEQRSLGLLDIGVTRNAYGRQLDSFIEPDSIFAENGKRLFQSRGVVCSALFESVFIRAPKIEWIGPKVEVLIDSPHGPTLVRQRNILGATFHPELSETTDQLYTLLFRLKGD